MLDQNPRIKNVNNFHNLEELYAPGDCGINNAGIQKCTKLKLNASWNKKNI